MSDAPRTCEDCGEWSNQRLHEHWLIPLVSALRPSRAVDQLSARVDALTLSYRRIKNCGRTGHWAKDCWKPGGEAYDNTTSNYSNT